MIEIWNYILNVLVSLPKQSFLLVVIGGMIGGLLLKPLSRIHEKLLIVRDLNMFYSALLGACAAGITVFVVANTETDDPEHLFFLSVLGGLAFPSVLLSAIENITKRTAESDQMNELERQSRSQERQPEIADEAAEVLAASKPISEHSVRAEIDQNGKNILDNIWLNTMRDKSRLDQSIADFSKIGKAAKESGYPRTRFVAMSKIKELIEAGELNEEQLTFANETLKEI